MISTQKLKLWIENNQKLDPDRIKNRQIFTNKFNVLFEFERILSQPTWGPRPNIDLSGQIERTRGCSYFKLAQSRSIS